jgi:hypothetical protein
MNINRMTMLTWLAQLSCGIWLGMLLLFGYGVAAPIFQLLDSKTQAGLLNGIILRHMNGLAWICAAGVLFSSLALYLLQKNKWMLIRLGTALLMTGILFYYSEMITPQMETLRATIQNFDIPRAEDKRPEREAFDRLHGRYSAAVAVNLVLALGMTFLIATTKKNDR